MANPSSSSAPSLNALRQQIRAAFVEVCHPWTKRLHKPIQDLVAVNGHLNPSGLGRARWLLQGVPAHQSSVAFDSLEDYEAADAAGNVPAYDDSAEYGVVRSWLGARLCRKLMELHDGAGAVLCPSGLSAISTVFEAFKPKTVLIPDNAYSPVLRYLRHTQTDFLRYPAGATKEEFAAVLKRAQASGATSDQLLVYLEAPGSGTFEIPDIEGIVAEAKAAGLRTAMDNTWASHVRCRPIEYGIDLVIQALTKYEGGWADATSGAVIARRLEDHKTLARHLRCTGHGAVALSVCALVLGRINSTKRRMDIHAATAQKLMAWFKDQPFVEEILSPALEASPRFQKYFGAGNGLFSVVFKEDVPQEKIAAFLNCLNLFRPAESWGGHVSLVLPAHPDREHSAPRKGIIIRFHAGLEHAPDLLRDLEEASRVFVGGTPTRHARPGAAPC
jgi:cysteine-S-conjugate beta-lyase